MIVLDEATVAPRQRGTQEWLSEQDLSAPVSSSIGSSDLPFQRWFRFKEAYSPAFVTDTLAACDYPVRHLLDPFGGSGTTALTARMEGLDSTSIEVNPFLADLIQAKVTPISVASFRDSSRRIIDGLRVVKRDYELPHSAPATLTEPGVGDRYVYGRETYGILRALNRRIDRLQEHESRLARVLLGGILVDCSNVRVNGKGRRYRRNWETRQVTRQGVLERFHNAVTKAIEDLTMFSCKSSSEHRVYTDDARSCLGRLPPADLAIFSPPYPNSFDYTDVYNLELWMLGYFRERRDNQHHRARTLRSHVQVKWPEVGAGPSTPRLNEVTRALDERRDTLWNRHIPEMVVGYFADLERVLVRLKRIVPKDRHVVAAVGDSQYGGVRIDTAEILAEIAQRHGYCVEDSSEIRSMRASAQHGGRLELSETALRLKRVQRER